MSKEVRTWAMLGGFMEIADTPGNEAPSRYTRYVRETDHKEVVDALLAERDALAKAAQRVLDGLNARIDEAVMLGGPLPVFEGIADLHDALQGAQP